MATKPDTHILKRLEAIDGRLGLVSETLIRQEMTLGEHVRRTDAAEENIRLLRTEVKPLTTHVAVVTGLLKGVGIVGSLVGIAIGVGKIVGFLP